jgi:hypothetical protein
MTLSMHDRDALAAREAQDARVIEAYMDEHPFVSLDEIKAGMPDMRQDLIEVLYIRRVKKLQKEATRTRLREALSDMKALKEWAVRGHDKPEGANFMAAWKAALAEAQDAAKEYAEAWGDRA